MMKLSALSLINFRNHKDFHLKCNQNQTVIIGPNGAGKTNILEAINLLATGETFREAKAEEMVHFEAEVGHVACKLQDEELQVTLTRDIWQGKRVSKKRYQVNGVPRTKAKFLGHFQVVCFRPEDLRIVEGSPARRRKFLDDILVQIDRQYAIALSIYTKALRHRNKLLEMIRERKTHPRALEYWDDLVIKHGAYINQKRRELIDAFNLDQPSENTAMTDLNLQYELVYDHSLMSRDRLDQYRHQELSAGHTLVGPHRDDFVIKGLIHRQSETTPAAGPLQDLATYGSRGQQRMGVLWLKLQSLAYTEAKTGQTPLLLLDDIFSELDHEHRGIVFNLMQYHQTIATTADKHYIEKLDQYQLIELA